MCLCPAAPFSILSHPFPPRIVRLGVKVYLETNYISVYNNCDFSKQSFLFLLVLQRLPTASNMAALLFFTTRKAADFQRMPRYDQVAVMLLAPRCGPRDWDLGLHDWKTLDGRLDAESLDLEDLQQIWPSKVNGSRKFMALVFCFCFFPQ